MQIGLKSWLMGIPGLCAMTLHAQVIAPDANSFVLEYTQAVTASHTSVGAGLNNQAYPAGNNYTMRFGEESSVLRAQVPHMRSFKINGLDYVRQNAVNTPPYALVRLRRVVGPQSSVQNLERFSGLFAQGSSTAGSGNARAAGTLYYAGEYATLMSDLINSTALNRGSDNTFTNSSTQTTNNIERVDLLFSNIPGAPKIYGANATVLAQNGVMITERGSGSADPFAMAAITSIDAAGNVTGLGRLVQVPSNTVWREVAPAGGTPLNYFTTVFLSGTAAGANPAEIKPALDVVQQSIRAVFLPLRDLGLQPDANQQVKIYGVALFGGDVLGALNNTQHADPTSVLSDIPSSTQGKSALQLLMTETATSLLQTGDTLGGLDLMGGGGIFSGTKNIALDAVDDDQGLWGPSATPRNLGALSAMLANDSVDGTPAAGHHIRITPTFPVGSPLSLDGNNELQLAANAPPGTYTFTYVNEVLSGPANVVGSHVLTEVDGTPFRSNAATVTVRVSALTADNDNLGDIAFSANARTVASLADLLDGDTLDGAAIASPGQVKLVPVVPPGSPLAWDANAGQLTLAGNAPAGTYNFTYTLILQDPAVPGDLLDAGNQPIVSNAATVSVRVLPAQPPNPQPPNPQPPGPQPGGTVAIPVAQGWVLPLLGSLMGLVAFWRRRFWA